MGEKYPELKFDHPIWWHHHGQKMGVSEEIAGRLIIESNAARLTIQKASLVFPGRTTVENDWFVDWKVAQCWPLEEIVSGRRWFTTEDVRQAFGLSANSGKYGEWLIERYGAEAAEQMKYIRWRCWLNIPGPGTGNDGDPNISILIDDKILQAVAKLLA
jgi:hypothetical protein